MRTCWSTLRGSPFEASFWERPKLGFQCTFPNTITFVSMAPRPHTDRGIADELRLNHYRDCHGKSRISEQWKPISLAAPITYLFP